MIKLILSGSKEAQEAYKQVSTLQKRFVDKLDILSQVHYDDDSEKNLKSATAISTIIHPNNPHVPSVHIHISLTQLRNTPSSWRIMADLNPGIANAEGEEQGDKYHKRIYASN